MSYRKGVKIFTGILIGLVAVAGVVLYFMYNVSAVRDNPLIAFEDGVQETADEQHINFRSIGALDLDTVTINGQTYKQKANTYNILLLGIDKDSNRDSGRSDMIMLCTVDFDTNDISMLSIPRDTKTTVYHVDENGKVTSEETNKLNAAYAFGGKNYKAENAMRCTADFLTCGQQVSVPIDYYMSIDLDGLPKLADALDGVEVTLDQSFPGLGGAGDTITLRGENVRKYLENRHDMNDGEYTRQKHQRDFLMSMARKIKSMGAVSAAPKLFSTFMNFMDTNLDLQKIVGFATILDNASLDAMVFEGLTEGDGSMDGGTWYYHANEDEVLSKMLARLYTPV